MRVLPLLLALPLLATFAPPSLFHRPSAPAHPILGVAPVPLEEGRPERTRVGKLRYLGGWALRSNDARFGGISALHVDAGGVTALSDAGIVMRFALPGHGDRRLAIAPLGDGPGSGRLKMDRDSESLVVAGRRAWVGFERRNAVWRYTLPDWRSDARSAPPAMRKWPGNEGSEAMLRLPGGRFLVFSEGGKGPEGSTEVLAFDGDPAVPGTSALRLGYRAPPGYKITDAALLPDGRLLFLNRRFALLEGFSARLTVARLPVLQKGLVLSGEEIAYLRAPLAVDNMEGLSVTQERGRTILWIASDDNLNALQRTLLLKFALAD